MKTSYYLWCYDSETFRQPMESSTYDREYKTLNAAINAAIRATKKSLNNYYVAVPVGVHPPATWIRKGSHA